MATCGPIRPLRCSPRTTHHSSVVGPVDGEWYRLSVPNVVRAVRERGFGEVDLLYIDSQIQLFWLDRVRHRYSVARVGDRYAGFTGISPQVLDLQHELIRSVDIVACSSGAIVEDLQREGVLNTLHLPNGVDYHHFGDSCADRSRSSSTRSRTRYTIYVGDMADWFDYELVNRLTEALTEVSFVFVGPDRMARARLTPRDNVHILGRRPFEDLPAYLWNADVGLIPFDVRSNAELVHAVHPLKLYEYLACELPTVASRWDELERLASPALLCDDLDGFRRAIVDVIAEPPDPAAGRVFAEHADWWKIVSGCYLTAPASRGASDRVAPDGQRRHPHTQQSG